MYNWFNDWRWKSVKLETGQIVRIRSRQYIVEESIPPLVQGGDTLVRLACLEDDAQGQTLEVFWEREIDATVVGTNSWDGVLQKGFDHPRAFSAYYHTLKWNCVTSTNPKLFQAPYRAGIEVKAYQLEPLRKALLQPRVALFIADDVGLGKTIEAGLILREMLMRQKIKRVVISCPPSVVRQWQEEMESRFGLLFQIYDLDFVSAKRRERGYGINPWKTHSRFIISHALLRDEAYAAPLRDWLGDFSSGSMFILDEAHNAAPASASRYAIDSQLTKIVRDLAPRFEHKLFLSATPHNGHSNSFAALLEILDPQRFCRGVPVKSKKLLDAVMVRRLKQDLRAIGDGDFPQRLVIPIEVGGLSLDAPELKLARLLQEYRACREERLKDATKSKQATAMLVMTSLQKRLLSSIEAFARTLAVHRRSVDRQVQSFGIREDVKEDDFDENILKQKFPLLAETVGNDDDRAELSEQEIEAEEDLQMETASHSAWEAVSSLELDLLNQMNEIAQTHRHNIDGKVQKLIEWIKANLCPDLGSQGATWNDRRLLIFTEYMDTKRYLQQALGEAIALSDLAQERIDVFTGGMGDEAREKIKTAFNTNPNHHPLRILIATDAAREGVNLQNYCSDLFHFDVPWNPSRMEQRNGRIDRKLQRSQVVRCHYFYLPQRTEDRVLDVLIKKTITIQDELGSLSPVIARNLSKMLDFGIKQDEADLLIRKMNEDLPSNQSLYSKGLSTEKDDSEDTIKSSGVEGVSQSDGTNKRGVILQELESVRTAKDKLLQQQMLLEDMLRDSRAWLGLDDVHFREALSVSLEMMGVQPLQPLSAEEVVKQGDSARWVIPALNEKAGGDPTWSNTLDTLRPLRKKKQKLWEWRKETDIRPVVFRDPGTLDGEVVHLHLEHRLVQRLLGRFISQGFIYHELSRACVCHTDDPVPKVVILGRLSLYGDRAARLHDEIVAVAAEWIEPSMRGSSKLRPLTEGEKKDVLQELDDCLATPRLREVSPALFDRYKAYAPQDVKDLLSALERRAKTLTERAQRDLNKRGDKEAEEMRQLLAQQRDRILQQEQLIVEQEQIKQLQLFDLKKFSTDEFRQLEADRRHWRIRLEQLETEMETEPQRIRQTYQVSASRVEPVGLVYLVPVSS